MLLDFAYTKLPELAFKSFDCVRADEAAARLSLAGFASSGGDVDFHNDPLLD